MPLKTDTEVKLPPAVTAAAKAAEAYYQQEQVTDAAADGDAPSQPTVESGQGVDPSPPQEAKDFKKAAPDPSPAPVSAEQQVVDDTPKDLKRSYNSMKARWERSEAEKQQLARRVSEMENQFSALQAVQSPPVVPAQSQERFLSPEEEQEYGSEFLGVVGKKAKEEFSPAIKSLQAEIEALKKQLGQVGSHVAKSARDELFEQLNSKVSNWRQLNEDDQFLSWLGLPDRYSGAIRHDLLKSAFERNDTARVLNFFQGFLSEAATGNADETPHQEALNTSNGGKAPKVPLETFAAPGRAKSAAASSQAPAEKPIITSAQITSHYADSAAGRYRGRDDAYQAFERLISEAQRDGRIV